MSEFIKKVKIAGIINVIFGGFLILLSEKIALYSGVLLITGILLLILSSKPYEELITKERSLIIIALINLLFNIVSSFIIFLAIDSIKNQNIYKNNSPPTLKEKNKIDPETKKIDTILKLGVLMVLISGLLFATTSWSLITDLTKSILLLLIGILFIGLSKFVDIKLKIKKTSNTYWLLGMFFHLFFIISLMYFKIITPWFSFTGAGKYICNSITLITVSLIALLSTKKFQTKGILYITYLSIYLAFCNFLQFFNLTSNIIVSIVMSLVLIGNILLRNNNNSYLYKTNKIINYFAWFVVLINYFNDYSYLASFIAALVVIANLYYILFKSEDNFFNKIIPIISAGLLIITVPSSTVISWCLLPSIIIMTGLYLLIAFTNSHDKVLKTINQITYNIFNLIAIFLLLSSQTIVLEAILASIIFLIINIINNIKLKNIISVYMQPITILLTITSLFNYIKSFIDLNLYHQVILLILTYILIHNFIKKEENKKLYYICILISTIFLHIVSLTMRKLSIIAIILLPISYIYLYCKTKENKKALKVATYSLLMLSIHNFFIVFNITELHPILASLITIWLYIVLLYFKENKIEKNIILIAIILPLINIIKSITVQINLKSIIENMLIFYITYLIIIMFVKEEKSKNIISTVGFILAMLIIIFKTSTLIGIYVGIISILAIILGYYKNEYKNLFKLGIIATLFNIIYQLRYVWGKIPFWLYLLIAGLGLITFVTYKEIIKNDIDKNH